MLYSGQVMNILSVCHPPSIYIYTVMNPWKHFSHASDHMVMNILIPRVSNEFLLTPMSTYDTLGGSNCYLTGS